MITSLNEEELYDLYDKVALIKNCKRLIELGYKYEPDTLVEIDAHMISEYSYNEDHLSIFLRLVGNSLGDGSVTLNDEDNIYSLECEDLIVPTISDEGGKKIIGCTIVIDNNDTKYMYENNIPINEEIIKIIKYMGENSMCLDGDLNVEEVQCKLTSNGLYIVIPDESFWALDIFYYYCDVLEEIATCVVKQKGDNHE
jgi:hypothetical protein